MHSWATTSRSTSSGKSWAVCCATAFPAIRLPRERLDEEIASILSTGIHVHTEVSIGKDVTFKDLKKQYDCLYISIGAHTDKKTGIPGEDSRDVMSAVEMLRRIGDDDMPDFTGKSVVVIGGGNVAMDVTRSSIRLGAKQVSCVYRRRAEDMTAQEEEVQGAVAEGAELLTLQAPIRIEADEARQRRRCGPSRRCWAGWTSEASRRSLPRHCRSAALRRI